MKNAYEIRGDVTVIFVKSKGIIYETLINTEDLSKVMEFPNTWYAHWEENTKSHYVRGMLYLGNRQSKSIKLHRYLMGDPDGKIVDHIDNDTLNNIRKTNLRTTTHSKNSQNRTGLDRNNTSGCRGVHRHRGKWRVIITANRKPQCFGIFNDLEEAKKVAEEARRKLHDFPKPAN